MTGNYKNYKIIFLSALHYKVFKIGLDWSSEFDKCSRFFLALISETSVNDFTIISLEPERQAEQVRIL